MRDPIADVPREHLVPQLADAMVKLLHNAELCRQMAAAGLDRVSRAFAWQQKATQMVAIYHDLLELPPDTSRQSPSANCHPAFGLR